MVDGEKQAGQDTDGSGADATTSVADLRAVMREFVDEREWRKFHNAKNLTMSLAIEAGELMEHFQWLKTEQVVAGEGYDLAGVRDELADVLCYGLSIANALDIDISTAIREKMVKNRLKYPAPIELDQKSEA
ncbi:MAG: nucleotide pyrophosphohydrolase [Pirellulaceae bacterium]